MTPIREIVKCFENKHDSFDELLINLLQLEVQLKEHFNDKEKMIFLLSDTLINSFQLMHYFSLSDETTMNELDNYAFDINDRSILNEDVHLFKLRKAILNIHNLKSNRQEEISKLKGNLFDFVKEVFTLVKYVRLDINYILSCSLNRLNSNEVSLSMPPDNVKKHKKTLDIDEIEKEKKKK